MQMEKIPAPFWAVILASMGAAIAFAVLFHQGDVNTSLAVLGIGSNLVSGALGFISGHAVGAKNEISTGNAPLTVNQNEAQPEKKV